jgi:hypothetical protein
MTSTDRRKLLRIERKGKKGPVREKGRGRRRGRGRREVEGLTAGRREMRRHSAYFGFQYLQVKTEAC